ncbi:hypothetical protein CH333_06805 [candidate division WOR-3 bacterium JGI_Cruoil_03_44_89]|uniref:Uncharacterized protein n=1 Tax=candidate division WOR-3 bacterium JGI_Cruoil_03_44_89 TaxID=1973748 RepID=A0A235BQL6_UNCW3|nr:MAG: hypothetical protein CH333_07525 [candidate division WOR-3 bacterium JGI_Cruoil_03_44_89]OYD14972.1 MAG: hypothetical protein CH333_06805 [candidate division WOR-3 bacterium JGI_Cruoil_03_44_89]
MLDKLLKTDRRIIFAILAVVVIIAILFPVGLAIQVSEPARRLYREIESLAPGSYVFLSFDYDPASMAELDPMALSVIRQCFREDLKIVSLGLWPQGVLLGEANLEKAAEEYGKEYGVDFVNLGYKTGGIVVISGISTDLRNVFPQDYTGRDIDELPILNGIDNLEPFKLVVTFSAGDPGVRHWVMIAQARYGKKVGCGSTAVQAPAFYPYLQSGQLVGLVGGMKGAAEYEQLIKLPGLATAGMDAQSFAHAVIVFFIVFGNAIFFLKKRSNSR